MSIRSITMYLDLEECLDYGCPLELECDECLRCAGCCACGQPEAAVPEELEDEDEDGETWD